MKNEDIDVGLFIERFEENFEQPIPKRISSSTCFRDLSEWSSLQALVIVSSFEENYGVTISSVDLESSETVQDLYVLVTRKIHT